MPGAVVIKKFPKGFQKKPLLVVVGTSVSKKATERNLVKRRIRAIMRKILKESPKEFTVIAKKGAASISYGDLEEEILKIIKNNAGTI